MLRDQIGADAEAHDDLNIYKFPDDFFNHPASALQLKACPEEKVVIRVVHPGGRARQRSFAMNGYDYYDLFPGFGFPHSVLLAPGKTMSAWLEPPMKPGTAIWHDGPTHIRAGGVWGQLVVADHAPTTNRRLAGVVLTASGAGQRSVAVCDARTGRPG